MTRAPIAALVAALFAATVVAQQATFKASVDLVSVDVLVTAGGKPVAGLAASDFEVRDNNVLQKIESITGEGAGTVALRPIPLDVVLVFDTSESVLGNKLTQLAAAGKAVLDILRPGDRAALVTFSHRTAIRPRFPRMSPRSDVRSSRSPPADGHRCSTRCTRVFRCAEQLTPAQWRCSFPTAATTAVG